MEQVPIPGPYPSVALPAESFIRGEELAQMAWHEGEQSLIPVPCPPPDEEESICSFCLGAMVEGERLTLTPCCHYFHSVCIRTHLRAATLETAWARPPPGASLGAFRQPSSPSDEGG